jgi:hypothetical protein
MSLDKQLKTLEEEHGRLAVEIRTQESNLSELQIRQEELEWQIMELKRTIVNKSGGLNLKDKFRLKEDLDQIGHMVSGIRKMYSMNMALVDCDVEDIYTISVSGELSDYKITICTSSELVKSIVRRCFTQEGNCHGNEESDLEKTTRNEWYTGTYSCCSRRFKYNVEETKELYNESEEQKEKYDNWLRSGKRIVY